MEGELSLAMLSKIKPMHKGSSEKGGYLKKKQRKKKGSFSIQCEEQKVYF